ncbi:MAG: DUF3168 domain-containing protein, partial [Bacillota bacterium]|nr:DUF3168 domain-containing protein [Bacillota bacterium]
VGAPAYWMKWAGDTNPPATYITFQTVNRPDLSADDALHEREHFVYLDVFSETDPYAVANAVRTAMEGAGFYEIEMRDVSDLGDKSNYFHISFTWQYKEDI